MAVDWRLARSLEVLLHEVNTLAPNRSKLSDGTIGDQRHQQEPSDHNPNAEGVVCALDITQDPAHGADMGPISEHLVAQRHPALKYVIFNRRINGRHTNWAWQPYTGVSPHTEHLHVSVGIGEDGRSTGPYDDTSPWDIGGGQGAAPPPAPAPGEFHTWGTGVRVHSKPSTHSEVVRTLPGPTPIHVAYQVHAENVVADGYTNDAWAFVPDLGGFLSNIYIDVPAPWLPGVPEGGAAPPPPPPAPKLPEFHTWGTGVRVHSKPSTHSEVVRTLPGPTPIHVAYQVHAENVVADGYTNDAWAFVPDLGGFLSNIYIDVPAPWLPGVPEGGAATPPPPAPAPHPQPRPGEFMTWGHQVRVHSKPSVQSAVVRTLDGPTPIHVAYQVHGEQVAADGYRNDGWAFVPDLGGFLSNIYVNVAQPWLPGVPEGGSVTAPPPPAPGGLPPIGNLSQEQLGFAKIIIQTGERHNVPEQGLVIAVATALQESALRNLGGGDRDSVGLFQQRPSQGWGTWEQCHDPVLASEAFYGFAAHTNDPGLMQVPNWQRMSVAQAAQAVQRSSDGSLYAKHEPLARELVAKLR